MIDDDDDSASKAKEIFAVGLCVIGVVALAGYFITSCEASRNAMLSDCLKSHTAAECKIMEWRR